MQNFNKVYILRIKTLKIVYKIPGFLAKFSFFKRKKFFFKGKNSYFKGKIFYV